MISVFLRVLMNLFGGNGEEKQGELFIRLLFRIVALATRMFIIFSSLGFILFLWANLTISLAREIGIDIRMTKDLSILLITLSIPVIPFLLMSLRDYLSFFFLSLLASPISLLASTSLSLFFLWNDPTSQIAWGILGGSIVLAVAKWRINIGQPMGLQKLSSLFFRRR